MVKSYRYDLTRVDQFEQARGHFLPKLEDSTIEYYEEPHIQFIEEYIRYRQAIIYRLQAVVSSSCCIPLSCQMSDFHLLYPVHVPQEIVIERQSGHHSHIVLKEKLATYTYIPKGNMAIQMQPGTYLAYGLLFDVGIIRETIYKDQHFLMQFRKRRLENKKLLYQSAYWPILDKTLFQIARIETIFFKYAIDNEGEVVKLIYTLFEIAEYKQFEVYDKLHEGELLAQRARQYISDRVTQTFSKLYIGDIHRKLQVSAPYLRRAHFKYYRRTMLEYRDELLIAKAQNLLGVYSANEVSNFCGFNQPSTFSDYFLKHIGVRPKEYQNKLLGNGQE